MKKKMKYLCSALVMFMLSICAFGCGDEASIELFVSGNDTEKVYEVAPGGTLQFETRVENVDEDTIEYLITNGQATITQEGKLTVDEDAIVKSTITVMAKSGDVKSNEITVNVIDLKPSTIDLISVNERTKIAKGGNIVFDVTFNPTYATIKDYTLSIVEGSDIAELNTTTNTLTIKDSADADAIVGSTIKVKATLNKDTTISDTMEISVVNAENVYSILAENKTINVQASGSQNIIAEAYNEAGDRLNIDADYFTYSSANESVATIEQSTGRIIPHGHGSSVITISTPDGKTGICTVNVIVAPESISLNNVSTLITDTKVMSYSKVDLLNLDIEMTNRNYTCTDKVKYTFELQDPSTLETIATGNDVAVVTDHGIEFKTTGRVLVTISSDSAIGSYNTSNLEKKINLVVNVNDGINVDSVADFVAYSSVDNAGKICNITKDLYLTDTENFGIDDAHKQAKLNMVGDRTIYGNGYIISTERLSLVADTTDEGNDFIEFTHNNSAFTVNIYDLELIGSTNVNGTYSGQLPEFASTSTINGNGDVYRTYKRGIVVKGTDYDDIESIGKNYVKDLVFSNVKVSGFDVGLRLAHIVNGFVTNCSVSNCYSNGIESIQNIIEFNNMTLGQVGAFGIEISSDEMADMTSTAPHGTAGANYNETSRVSMTGSITSTNYNNGVSTSYMADNYAAIPTVISGLISAMVGTVNNADKQALMESVANECMRVSGTEQELNMYLLIFINPMDFPNFTELGNTTNVFCEYSSDSSTGSIINMKEIMTNVALQGDAYTGYKNYKYVSLDLEQVPLSAINPTLSGTANLGQVILVNQAYEG